MEKILNSAMADEELNKAVTRKNEIVDTIEQRKAEFETADVEKRDEILNEVETLTKEGEELDAQIADLEEKRNAYKAQEERLSMNKTLSKTAIEERKDQIEDGNVLESKEYTQLYADYIRGKADKKEVRSFLEQRTIGTGEAGQNTFPIPQLLQQYVETAWIEYGKFSRLVSETFEPAMLRIPVEASATGAVWHEQGGDPVAEENITFSEILLEAQNIKKWISLTDELMGLSAPEFLRYIADELVYRVYKALDDAIINRVNEDGTGVIGIAENAMTVQHYDGGELTFNEVNEAIAGLVTFDDLVVAMNPATFFNNFMGMTDQVGAPIYRIATENDGRPTYYINGIRVEFTTALPSYAEAENGDVYIVVGNFRRGYRLNFPQGRDVITLVDPYTMMTSDVVRMLGRLYVAGNVVKPRHFASIIKGTNA